MTASHEAAIAELEQANAALRGQLSVARAERDAALARRDTEYGERIEHQSATIDVLRAMSASPGDAQPVFDLIAHRARDICGAYGVTVVEFDGTLMHHRASTGISDDPAVKAAIIASYPRVPSRDNANSRAILERRVVHIRDLEAEPGLNPSVRDITAKSSVVVPLMRGGVVIGTVGMGSRARGGFSDAQVDLLKTFAEQAVIAITSAETYRALQTRTADLQESLEYQTATSDVLRVISRSTLDLQPVLDTVAETAARLCDADQAVIFRSDGESRWLAANHGYPPEYEAAMRAQGEFRGQSDSPMPGIRAERERRPVHIHDARLVPGYSEVSLRLGGTRTTLGVPLLRGDEAIGFIAVTRHRVEPFTDRQIELLSTFADQSVIAIENTRLLTEQQEALEQQTATAEVLGVINRSPGELAPVFDAILEKAHTLCGATIGSLYTWDGESVWAVATHGFPEDYAAFARQKNPPNFMTRPLIEGERYHHVPDVRALEPTQDKHAATFMEQTDARAILLIPLRKDGAFAGFISVVRTEVRPFSEKEIALLENFAAQAVIAMENARLLGELRDRTAALATRNSEYGERIEQQSATIDVLKAMSGSPDATQSVFDLITSRARELCNSALVGLFEVDGDLLQLRSSSAGEPAALATLSALYPMRLSRGTTSCRAVLEKRIIHIRDVEADPDMAQAVRDSGTKSVVSLPLLRDDVAIGAIALNSMEPGGFSDGQIELLKAFAEQAVIAIGSAETWRALRERTAALAQRNSEFGERIEQQAATIDVLKVMSSTPDDTQPVFDQIVRRAKELCGGHTAALFEIRDGLVHFGAMCSDFDMRTSAFASYISQFPMVPVRGSIPCRSILDSRVIHIKDIEAEPDLSPAVRTLIRDGTYRSQVVIPLLREGRAMGCISLTIRERGGFTDSQVALLQTFAEQAVIAIGSVANFKALRERTAELTRSVAELHALEEVMRAVNSSLDLDTVLETIISRAVTLSQADEGTIYEFDDAEAVFVLKATHGMSETRVTRLREARIKLGDTYLGRAGLQREPVHVSDLQLDPTLPDTTKEALQDIHAVLAVPLLREDKVLGGLVIRRRTMGDFPATIPTLLQTFAAQSVLAIENARLFQDASRARRTAEATLTDLRRTQDRLVQTEKMASLGQLTAGIAHEIKNPLNFVNNFSDLSVDLLNELNEAVAPDKLTVAADLRAEIDDITATLKGNLERIAQHGRRADSIVKNMLLHSRTGPSEHREIDLNATVEEALNLAYHGARAETPGFNITLEKHLDPAAGTIDAFPQEFTRVLLNLMSNGFYAARKRMATAGAGFEPTLTVTTSDLGESVKIGVRDNGTGMPDTVRDKIFEPFFTTKPAGEGTGLGLSLSFDIVVKQHGGQLTVASELEKFTEFTVTLPRRVAAGATP